MSPDDKMNAKLPSHGDAINEEVPSVAKDGEALAASETTSNPDETHSHASRSDIPHMDKADTNILGKSK